MGKMFTSGQGSNPQLLTGAEVNDSVTTDPLNGTVNNLDVPNSALVSCIKLRASATVTLTGLAGGTSDRCLILKNISGSTITLSGNSASSSAANQFAASATLASGQTVALIYSSTLSKWCVAAAGGGTTSGALLSFQVLTGSGTYTPTSGTRTIFVTCIGAGGGSGGVLSDASTVAAAAGGGGGGLTSLYITSDLLDPSFTYSCGTAGTAGTASPTAGGTGGDTTFTGTFVALTANGGAGSAAINSTGVTTLQTGVSPSGGSASGGTLNVRGARGTFSIYGPTSIIGAGRGGIGAISIYGAFSGSGATGYGWGAPGTAIGVGTSAVGVAGGAGAIFVWEYS